MQSVPVLIRPKLTSVLIQSDPALIRAHLSKLHHFPPRKYQFVAALVPGPLGIRKCEFVYSWMYFFYNTTKIYENVQVPLLKRTLSSLILPVNVADLTC